MSLEEFIDFCKTYEPIAFNNYVDNLIVNDLYNESVNYCKGVSNYLNYFNFSRLVYRYALHLLIMQSINMDAPINTLAEKYSVKENTGLLTSASDSSSSASIFIGSKVNDGGADTMLLWATPYGQWCESVFEQLGDIVL